jgi:serine/threonine-protein kinase
MGKVWVARHKGLETEVVVKFLATTDADRAEAEARFAREAAAAAAVKSPHVVQVFDHGTTADGTRYIVMELLEGRDLAMHLAANGPMPARDVAAVIGQVAKALSKAHQAGVIHRDIKPENIFLCDGDGGEMFVKVLDFGIAKREQHATAKTTTGQVVGTPFYMSPEQILGEPPVDARTDIWSLGVVAFEALTGKRPFDGATVGAITLAIHRSSPRPSSVNPGVPPGMDEWFVRACARAPEDRFATAREAGQALLTAAGAASSPGMFRTPMMSLSETSDPLLMAHAGSDDARGRSVTSLSSSFAAPPSRRGPPRVVLIGAATAIAVLVALLVFSLRRSPDAEKHASDHAGSEPPLLPAPTVAPLASAVTASTSPATEPSASAPVVATPSASPVATARPKPTSTTGGRGPVTTGTRTARPPRKPNDDDIK